MHWHESDRWVITFRSSRSSWGEVDSVFLSLICFYFYLSARDSLTSAFIYHIVLYNHFRPSKNTLIIKSPMWKNVPSFGLVAYRQVTRNKKVLNSWWLSASLHNKNHFMNPKSRPFRLFRPERAIGRTWSALRICWASSIHSKWHPTMTGRNCRLPHSHSPWLASGSRHRRARGSALSPPPSEFVEKEQSHLKFKLIIYWLIPFDFLRYRW